MLHIFVRRYEYIRRTLQLSAGVAPLLPTATPFDVTDDMSVGHRVGMQRKVSPFIRPPPAECCRLTVNSPQKNGETGAKKTLISDLNALNGDPSSCRTGIRGCSSMALRWNEIPSAYRSLGRPANQYGELPQRTLAHVSKCTDRGAVPAFRARARCYSTARGTPLWHI